MVSQCSQVILQPADSIADHIRERLPPAVANLLLPLLSCPMSLLSLICFAAVCAAELLCHCGLPLVVDHAAAVAVAALVVSALAPVRVEYLVCWIQTSEMLSRNVAFKDVIEESKSGNPPLIQ